MNITQDGSQPIKKCGRPRILTDEERVSKNRDKAARVIKILAPSGFKDQLQGFIDNRSKGNMTDYLFKLINAQPDFKDYLKQQRLAAI